MHTQSRLAEYSPLSGGSYTVTYFRKGDRPCEKQDADAEIVHFYDIHGRLLHCEYHTVGRADT